MKEFRRLVWLWEGICPGTKNKGWCGCGDPHLTYVWLRDTLRQAEEGERFLGGLPHGAGRMLVAQLEHMGLIEHGSSWSGSWLTDEGRSVFAVLGPMSDADIEREYEAATDRDGDYVVGCVVSEPCPNCEAFGPKDAKVQVLFTSGEDGMVVATCPALPSVVSQGRTTTEARANVTEAVRLAVESGDVPSETAVWLDAVACPTTG